MEFERRLNQIIGCANGVRMEPGGDLPETNPKNLRVLRDLRGIARNDFLAPRRTRRARSMNIEQRSHQATDCCIIKVHMEPRLQKNLRVLRDLRGANSPFVSGPQHGF